MTKRLPKETYVYMKRDLQQRPTDSRYHRRCSGTTNISKETHMYEQETCKRDLQQRPTDSRYHRRCLGTTILSKETYTCEKRLMEI